MSKTHYKVVTLWHLACVAVSDFKDYAQQKTVLMKEHMRIKHNVYQNTCTMLSKTIFYSLKLLVNPSF